MKSITDSSAKHLHFQAPEIDEGLFMKRNENEILVASLFEELNQITTAIDIYSLGMVTLEVNIKDHNERLFHLEYLDG